MVKIEIGFEQLKKAIERLPARDRKRLLRSFNKISPGKNLELLFKSIDARLQKSPISQKEIVRAVEKTRRRLYGPRRR